MTRAARNVLSPLNETIARLEAKRAAPNGMSPAQREALDSTIQHLNAARKELVGMKDGPTPAGEITAANLDDATQLHEIRAGRNAEAALGLDGKYTNLAVLKPRTDDAAHLDPKPQNPSALERVQNGTAYTRRPRTAASVAPDAAAVENPVTRAPGPNTLTLKGRKGAAADAPLTAGTEVMPPVEPPRPAASAGEGLAAAGADVAAAGEAATLGEVAAQAGKVLGHAGLAIGVGAAAATYLAASTRAEAAVRQGLITRSQAGDIKQSVATGAAGDVVSPVPIGLSANAMRDAMLKDGIPADVRAKLQVGQPTAQVERVRERLPDRAEPGAIMSDAMKQFVSLNADIKTLEMQEAADPTLRARVNGMEADLYKRFDAMRADPARRAELERVTGVPIDPAERTFNPPPSPQADPMPPVSSLPADKPKLAAALKGVDLSALTPYRDTAVTASDAPVPPPMQIAAAAADAGRSAHRA